MWVPTWVISKKNSIKNICLVTISKATDKKSRFQLRIRLKMSRIRNTGANSAEDSEWFITDPIRKQGRVLKKPHFNCKILDPTRSVFTTLRANMFNLITSCKCGTVRHVDRSIAECGTRISSLSAPRYKPSTGSVLQYSNNYSSVLKITESSAN